MSTKIASRRSRTRGACVALVGMLALAGCGSSAGADSGGGGAAAGAGVVCGQSNPSWDSVVAAAKREGAVTWYSGQTPQVSDAINAAFTKQYPEIKLTVFRANSATLLQRAQAELKAGDLQFDVLTTSSVYFLEDEAKAGHTEPIASPRITDSKWSGQVLADNHVANFLKTPFGAAVLKSKFPNGVASYTDLVNDPNLTGRIGLPDYTSTTYLLQWYYIEKALGADFLTKLAAKNPKFYATPEQGLPAMVAGEIDAFLPAAPLSITEALQEKIGWSFVDPYTAASSASAVFQGVDHCNAGQVFVDFLMSDSGQSAGATRNVAAIPGVPGVVDSSQVKIVVKTEDFDDKFFSDYKNHLNGIFRR